MKKAIFLSLILPLCFGYAKGQNYTYIDSLMKELKLSEGASRAKLYLGIGWEYRKSHPDSTIYYCERALELASHMKSIRGIRAQALNYKGVAYHYMGENLKSFEYYNQAIEEAVASNDSIQYAHAFNSLGRMYMYQGDYIKAYDYYFKALKVFERYDNQEGLGYGYKSLSELYQTQENYEKALEMSEKTLNIRLETDNIHGQISILIEIANIHQKLGHFEKAFDFFLQAKIKAESIDDQANIANINLGISSLYYDDNKFEEALIYAQKSYNAVKSTQNMNLINQVLIQLGKIHYQRGNLNAALDFLERGIEVAQKAQDLTLLKDGYYYTSEIYRKRDDYKNAYDNYVLYNDINDRLGSAEVARTIERFESRIEIDKQERKNELLMANQARDQAIIERQRIQNIALLAVTVVVLVLVVSLYVNNRKRKQANDRLHEKNQRIAQQREEITSQNEQIKKQNESLKHRNEELAEINNEKNTLMNIVAHDLKSPLNRIKGLVELLKLSGPNDEQKNYIELLNDISKGGIDLIRDLLDVNAFEEDKRKPEITDIDVHDLLLEKTKLFYADGKAKGIEIKTPSVEHHLLLKSDEVYLSRILDNLISNAIKFSDDNSQVVLKAGKENGHVFISVKDQGPGFSEEDKQHIYTKFKKLSARPTAGESSNGLGLAIVKTLVDRLEGEIELITAPNQGSEFIIKFPLQAVVSSARAN